MTILCAINFPIFSLVCGSTWHSGGVVGRLRTGAVERTLSDVSAKLYQQLEDEGYHTGTQSMVPVPFEPCHAKKCLPNFA